VPCYANSVLFQEKELAGRQDWGPGEIEARRAEILAWARGRWAVEDGPLEVEIDEAADED
jgi:hypothetical protein